MLSTAILRSAPTATMVITTCIGTKNPGQLLIILGDIKENFFQGGRLVETNGRVSLGEAVHETIEILVGNRGHPLDPIVPVIDHTPVIIDIPGK